MTMRKSQKPSSTHRKIRTSDLINDRRRFLQCILLFRKAKTQHMMVGSLMIKNRDRDRGQPEFFRQAYCKIRIFFLADLSIIQQLKIRSRCRRKSKIRIADLPDKEVALFLVKITELQVMFALL